MAGTGAGQGSRTLRQEPLLIAPMAATRRCFPYGSGSSGSSLISSLLNDDQRSGRHRRGDCRSPSRSGTRPGACYRPDPRDEQAERAAALVTERAPTLVLASLASWTRSDSFALTSTDSCLLQRAVVSPIAAALLLLEQSGCDIHMTPSGVEEQSVPPDAASPSAPLAEAEGSAVLTIASSPKLLPVARRRRELSDRQSRRPVARERSRAASTRTRCRTTPAGVTALVWPFRRRGEVSSRSAPSSPRRRT
jgi:hypothetical protein